MKLSQGLFRLIQNVAVPRRLPPQQLCMKHAATEFLLKVFNEFEKGGTEIEMCIHQHQVVRRGL